MPNDAKLGLVVGVALVLTVAVVFFRKETADAEPATSVGSARPVTTQPPPRPAVARATARDAEPALRRHTVREGETLFGLAQRYYGDGERFDLISRFNGQGSDAEAPLTPGTVLVIPNAEEQPDGAADGTP